MGISVLECLKKYLPTRHTLGKEGSLGKRFYHPKLWQLERQSVAMGTAMGLLAAFIPLPGQALIAAFLAYIGRGYLPISLVMTWITNPLTFIPINYGIYRVGQWLTGDTTAYHHISEFHWQGATLIEIGTHLYQWLASVGKPFLLGTLVVALTSAFIGYVLVHVVWGLGQLWIKKAD